MSVIVNSGNSEPQAGKCEEGSPPPFPSSVLDSQDRCRKAPKTGCCFLSHRLHITPSPASLSDSSPSTGTAASSNVA